MRKSAVAAAVVAVAALAAGCSGGEDGSEDSAAGGLEGGVLAAGMSAGAQAAVGAAAVSSGGGITVVGTGTTTTTPDTAEWSFGVQTSDETAEGALAANSEAMDKVVAALRAAGISSDDLQTEQVSVYPRTSDDGTTVVGYDASSSVHATVHDLDQAGRVVDAAVGAGREPGLGPEPHGLRRRCAVRRGDGGGLRRRPRPRRGDRGEGGRQARPAGRDRRGRRGRRLVPVRARLWPRPQEPRKWASSPARRTWARPSPSPSPSPARTTGVSRTAGRGLAPVRRRGSRATMQLHHVEPGAPS